MGPQAGKWSGSRAEQVGRPARKAVDRHACKLGARLCGGACRRSGYEFGVLNLNYPACLHGTGSSTPVWLKRR